MTMSTTTNSNSNSNKSSNPWGVSLKKTEGVPERTSLSPQPKNSEKRGSLIYCNRRETLRPAPAKAARPKKTKSREFKLKSSPFELNNKPLFGVVLRSSKQHYDLKFKGVETASTNQQDGTTTTTGSHSTPSTENIIDAQPLPAAPFGVRLKPVRRRYNKEEALRRTFQIDLHPPPLDKIKGGRYPPESKAFLEIKLKPVQRKTHHNNEQDKPEFVELVLSHWVAPKDGGPRKQVTQASFQIPLLKSVNLEALLRQRKEQAQLNARDPFVAVLQLQIENLTHVNGPRPSTVPPSQTIQINLRHVDPVTKEVTHLGQAIRIELNNTPPTQQDTNRPSGEMPPSMKVSLRHVSPCAKERHDATPDFAKVHLKSPVHVVEDEAASDHEEEDKEDSHSSGSSDSSDSDVEEESSSEDSEQTQEEEEPSSEHSIELPEPQPQTNRDMRSSLPNIDMEQVIANSEEIVEEEIVEEEIMEEEPKQQTEEPTPPDTPEATTPKEEEKEEKKPRRRGRGGGVVNKNTIRRTRSSSLTDVDRLRERRDKYIARKEEEGKQLPTELSNQKRRDLLMWYNRMKCPNKEEMKRKVAHLPPDCDITPHDVELLPWLCKGRYLDLRVMNQFFMTDWQGEDDEDE